MERNDSNDRTDRTARLSAKVRQLLEERADEVPFHGWVHTDFVRRKAARFATERQADVALVEAAALVHDLNYLESPGSGPRAGRNLRTRLLSSCGFSAREIERIEEIILAAHMETRQPDVDDETACLSDADTLYKTLPITPVLFSHRYLAENRMKLVELAKKILGEQRSKLDGNYYFYDQRLAKRYQRWAEANLRLWQAVLESLSDPDVALLVEGEGHG